MTKQPTDEAIEKIASMIAETLTSWDIMIPSFVRGGAVVHLHDVLAEEIIQAYESHLEEENGVLREALENIDAYAWLLADGKTCVKARDEVMAIIRIALAHRKEGSDG